MNISVQTKAKLQDISTVCWTACQYSDGSEGDQRKGFAHAVTKSLQKIIIMKSMKLLSGRFRHDFSPSTYILRCLATTSKLIVIVTICLIKYELPI